jgi:hypothetical protein
MSVVLIRFGDVNSLMLIQRCGGGKWGQVGGSGVLVQPMTYIFDEEPARWRKLLQTLGLSNSNGSSNGTPEASPAA